MSTVKKALITGVTGQDGAYLAELLLEKGYEVHGLRRRLSRPNTQRIDHLISDTSTQSGGLILHHGDMADSTRLTHIVRSVQPDEVYNLAAQSHVQVSFETPEYTTDVDALGTLRLLEAIRLLGMGDRVRFYQASTSELFGQVAEMPQNENTPFHPRSPYGVSKLYAYWITVNYREAYGMYACNGILFNHESPRRGAMFVTRKVTQAAARIALGLDDRLYLGNLEARRDWGHAKDYVDAIWRILQQDEPEDFVVATGKVHTVRQVCEMAFGYTGIDLHWEGEGVEEKGYDRKTGALIVEVDPHFFRPAEVHLLQGDASKARKKLGWVPRYSIQEMIEEMVEHDLALVRKNQGSTVEQSG
ncbi:MAG: GDP-mannose 4,6-dehydratase [Bacteroidetes bacterium SB0662_bin_6]|nr:GDP-mannose 4,6-dehydratase [Bacteroidetes bacterium SB0668_bin_1]MYE05240.1 GDP-mannose 4,6-dehydratase [Bacteroidetes bacterium SB0662_bin_6]